MQNNHDIATADAHHLVRTGLDDTEGGETFAAWTTNDDPDTEASIPITLSGGLYRTRSGNLAQSRDHHTRASVRLKSSDDSTRWLALALMAEDPSDIRPDLLALVWTHHTAALPRLIRYGADYLRASGCFHDASVLQAAAADALLIVAYGRTRADGKKRKCNADTVTPATIRTRTLSRQPTTCGCAALAAGRITTGSHHVTYRSVM